jgi:hypothetical protein
MKRIVAADSLPVYVYRPHRRYLMKQGDQAEFGAKRETDEIYVLSKKERVLTREVRKLALSSPARRRFLIDRFGKEGLEIATSLLSQMGFKVGKTQGQKPGTMP